MSKLSGVINHKSMEEYLTEGISNHFREEVGKQIIKETVEQFSNKITEIVEAELKEYIKVSIESMRNMAEMREHYDVVFHKKEEA